MSYSPRLATTVELDFCIWPYTIYAKREQVSERVSVLLWVLRGNPRVLFYRPEE
jgi:hypothetical protein